MDGMIFGRGSGMTCEYVRSSDEGTAYCSLNGPPITGETSDGHHTFDELYEYRLLYNAALFNELARNPAYVVHKSWRHSDGEPCFGGGWFIVSAQLPTGQITNHYKAAEWSLFKISATATAAPWDGHDPAEAARRLRAFVEAA